MRKYDEEFKQEAVKKIHDGQSVPSVARELGCAESLLHKWKRDTVEASFDAEREVIALRKKFNCGDNAQAESLFSRYKAELLEDGFFEDVNRARSDTFSYVEGYYNRVRRHSALGYRTPAGFEREINLKKKESSSESIVSRKT